MILLKNCTTYAPKYLGKKYILIGGGQIILIKDKLPEYSNITSVKVIDCSDKIAFPGFIDSHVHICGAGGEGGFETRTTEVKLTDLTSAGITTVVGCLGTDGVGRTLTNLISKSKGLKKEGISSYVNTGSYQVPVRTLTGEIAKDIMMIEEVIGVGEIAISDHRSSQPNKDDIKKLVAEARVGGLLSGKAGIVNFHIGDGSDMLNVINEIIGESELPKSQFYPTHMNRNPELFKCAVEYANSGGIIDFTTSTTEQYIADGEIRASEALSICLEKGVKVDRITFSSDGQGSLPAFDENGVLCGLTVGSPASLYESVREAILKYNVSIEDAIKVITENPANILKFRKKGKLIEKMDADIVLVDSKDYSVQTVFAKSVIMIENGEIIVNNTFN